MRTRVRGVMFITDNEVKMKESIFRVLSLFIGLGGVFALALDTSIILESTMTVSYTHLTLPTIYSV